MQHIIDSSKGNRKKEMGPSNQPCKNPILPGSGARLLCCKCNLHWLERERTKAGNGGGKMPASRKRKAAVVDEDVKIAAKRPSRKAKSKTGSYSESNVDNNGNLKE